MIQKMYNWYYSLSRQFRTSICMALGIIGVVSSILSLWGITISDFISSKWIGLFVILVSCIMLVYLIYFLLGRIYRSHISLVIRNTPVEISCGDIFEADGLKVISCDTHFDGRIDNTVISKGSLHGQLFLKHGNIDEIRKAVDAEAARLELIPNADGSYDFPLGTIIKYESSVDGQTYLMLALTELNQAYEAHTDMARFEQTLMHMWKEISRVYAGYDIALPILGTGITRFDDGPKGRDGLLRCMLCTMNSSGISFKSKVRVVVWDNSDDIPLYEYQDLFHSLPGRMKK